MRLFNNTNMRTAMAYTNDVGDKVYPVIVDIKKGIKSTEEILFVSSDINTGILSVAFIQGNDTYNVVGAEVVCSVMRPDASTLDIPCTVIENNIVEVPLGVNGTSQDGVYSFDFKVFKGGNKIVGTPIMNYSVSLSISNDLVVEEDDRLPVLTMLMTQVNELKEETRETINQANAATVATKVATANAIEATNNVNATINNANQKMLEVDNAKNDMTNTVTSKIDEVETRFNALTSSQQQDAEVIDARDGETSLKARLDRDIEKAKQVYVNVEGSNISTDSSVGYLKDVEILGNTIQNASNLADIRSVGDKVEGQELYEIPVVSCGKNLLKDSLIRDFTKYTFNETYKSIGIKVEKGKSYIASLKLIDSFSESDLTNTYFSVSDYCNPANPSNPKYHHLINKGIYAPQKRAVVSNDGYIYFCFFNQSGNTKDVFDKLMKNIEYIQLEEGTVATEYEPYQEYKLTILSPVQLEKVGDVRDRIICRDGVWGVEKNIIEFNFSMATNITSRGVNANGLYGYGGVYNFGTVKQSICNKLPFNYNWNSTYSCFYVQTTDFVVLLDRNLTLDEFKAEYRDMVIKYPTATPQFIPLPHDQQVKLRTFANKTNISFGCEIEGTIKAQVPKSLGATVNTHTEQISNLNKELDRVKKLEESTVSTVETESDFTTVEATSNGYFEDVKLEGKTLVNLYKNEAKTYHTDYVFSPNERVNLDLLIPCNTYTAIVHNSTTNFDTFRISSGDVTYDLVPLSKNTIVKFIYTPPTNDAVKNDIRCYCYPNGNKFVSGDENKISITILEGDHTQNPPSFFEGLKSVGQDVDEIVVSSGKSLNFKLEQGTLSDVGTEMPYSNRVRTNHIQVSSGNIYINTSYKRCAFYKNGIFVRQKTEGELIVDHDVDSVRIAFEGELNNLQNIVITQSQDKKRLLFYNEETQTLEKPVLREWDSIEKHSDGKYYYHQRSGEEGYTKGDESVSDYITDMTTTVKPLAQEKVYECTNIDLITYTNETNYIVECGAIAPKTTLKVHNNISNVVKILQEKVSLLESNVKASQEVQDMMILETDMRMLDIELALMEFVPMTLNLGGNSMLRSATYFNFVKNHIVNETYEKEYLENVMNKYLATGRINQDEYDELYKMLYPPVYDIELPIEL